jgi:GNAT superfamily N-acetyltransferase
VQLQALRLNMPRFALPLRHDIRAALMSDSEESDTEVKPEPVDPAEVELIPDVAIQSGQNSVAIWWLLQKARALSQDIFQEDCLETCKRGEWKITLLGSKLQAGADVRLHGFAIFRVESPKKTLSLCKIAVPEADRRHGFGRKLMDWLVQFAKQHREVNRVELSSLAGAIPFYERLGFRKFGKNKNRDEPDDILFPGQIFMELSVHREATKTPAMPEATQRFPKPAPVTGMKSKKRLFFAVVAKDAEVVHIAAEECKEPYQSSLGLRRTDRLLLSGLDTEQATEVLSELHSNEYGAQDWRVWAANGVSVATISNSAAFEKAIASAPHAILVSAEFLQKAPTAVEALADFQGALLVIEDAKIGELGQQLRLHGRWQCSEKGFGRGGSKGLKSGASK